MLGIFSVLVRRLLGMHFHIVSLFPELFDSPLRTALLGRALEAGVVSCSVHNPRDCATDRHRTVDDRPYGGGPGMVMLLPPLLAVLRALPDPGRIVVMSPGGRPLTQAYARELACEPRLTLVCGRYEGIDARLAECIPVEYVSVGDIVCNGGEVPALMLIESVARLVPGFMGAEDSGIEESFATGLLEYPHYTRPEEYEGHRVPEILRGGDHARVAGWRRGQSLCATLHTRPDMLASAPLNTADAALLSACSRECLGHNFFVVLAHYPVMIEGKNSGTSSLTNLDVHDIARVCRTYGLGGFYITTPLDDQRAVLETILRHWLGTARASHPDRAKALELVRGVPLIEDAVAHVWERTGYKPRVLGTSARWPDKKKALPCLTVSEARAWLRQGPVVLLCGTGHGLAPHALSACDRVLRPLRCLDQYNHLSVRAAVAIVVDRILGDVF